MSWLETYHSRLKTPQEALRALGADIADVGLDDYEGRGGRLASMVRSIEEKMGKPVRK